MAENEKPDSTDDKSFADFDEDLELDLFDDGSDPDAGDALDEFADAPQDATDSELQDELGDGMDADLDSSLDEDIIDLSDDDLKEEFAALDREEAQNSVAEPDPVPDLESVELDDSLDNTAADSNSDDLYVNMTSEEFGAPDQYSAEFGTNTNSENKSAGKKTGKAAATPDSSGLPALLAALSALSPRMIVAATAAVLLPLVLFATLGFNADQSDADENTGVATFVDQSNSSEPDSSVDAEAPPPRIEPPEPDRIQVPELPAENSPAPNTETVAAVAEPVTASSSSPITTAEQSDSQVTDAETVSAAEQPESAVLLAQADTAEPDPGQVNAESPTDNLLERSVAATTQDADGQPISQEPETSEPAPVSDHSPESPLTEDISTANRDPAVIIDGTAASGRNYHVVVASFPNEDQARQHAASVSDEEISAYVIPPFGASNNYRVAVAGYSSMAEARENIPGLQAVYGGGIWPLRYPPSPPLETISGQTGDTYIIVASFPSEELARNHAAGLVADGEQPVIIAPYPPANRYRVAASYFDSPTNAANALPRYRQNYGEDVWLLNY